MERTAQRRRLSGEAKGYLWVAAIMWGLPALATAIGYAALPKHNESGQCEGIGWGCTLAPADGVVFMALLAAPFLLFGGLLLMLAVSVVSRRRRRR